MMTSQEVQVREAILSAAKTLAERSTRPGGTDGQVELNTTQAVLNLVTALCMLRDSED